MRIQYLHHVVIGLINRRSIGKLTQEWNRDAELESGRAKILKSPKFSVLYLREWLRILPNE